LTSFPSTVISIRKSSFIAMSIVFFGLQKPN
jgi:hypothetical protein